MNPDTSRLAVVIATANRNKLKEIRELVDLEDQLTFYSLGDFPGIPDVVEDGTTYEENAAKKAVAGCCATGLIAIADDSGLEVDALNGAPGVYSARYAGEGCSYADNNRKLLRALEGVPDERRTARFVCVAAIALSVEDVRFVAGEVRGKITSCPRGEHGFGYDPIFVPNGYDRTFGELSPEVKQQISHRSRAFRLVKAFLGEHVLKLGRTSPMR